MVFRKGNEQQLVARDAQKEIQGKSVPQLVEMWAARTPQAVALVVGEQVVSYGELNRQANQIAHYLQQRGVGPNVCVALCLGRSVELVIALLGILKAGGVYVAFDPHYPAERLAFLCADVQAPMLITRLSDSKHLPQHDAANRIYMDADAALLEQQSAENPVTRTSLTDLAYIVYTSGSTGRPKGAKITHDNLLNLIFWHQSTFEITAADHATQLASPAFDVMGYELWPYLTAGASLYVVDNGARVEAVALRNFLVDKKLTMAVVPTLLAEQIIVLEWPARTQLRYLLTGGDMLHQYPPASLPFAFVNNYGPAEATVQVLSGVVPPTEHPGHPPALGRPIDNTQIHLLDERRWPVAIGEVGEIYIGGKGVGAGYLNHPELTAQRFIDNPSGDRVGERLYKTGDLAKYLPDGQLIFVGRADHQIKIRGYRIEPGEIIAALNKLEAIKISFVMAREETPGEKRLIAYIILEEGKQITVSALRQALLESLPDYMVPTAFVVLDVLPVTSNGKINQKALPAPNLANILQDKVVARPGTPVEERVAAVVASLLQVEQVDIDDNFFLLGGHSMLGAQVVAQIAKFFDIELSLRVLYAAPSVRELSQQVERSLFEKIAAMSDEEAQSLL